MPSARHVIARPSTILLCISVAFASTPGEALHRGNVGETSASCLVLEWMDPHGLMPGGGRWLAKETIHILDRAGIRARWERPQQRVLTGEARAHAHEHRVRVVLVPSKPSGPGWRLSPNTLGVSVVEEDGSEAPPAVYIFYHSVAALLGARDHADHRTRVQASRALGRVVAHEVAHAIAPLEPHARDGLMRANLETRFLTARGDVAMDARWRSLLVEGMSELCSAS